MKLAFLITSLLLACTQRSGEPVMITNPNSAQHTYTFLSLGDSYTIGESVAESARWPVQLASMLRKDGIDMGNPDIIARTGWTTAELQKAISASRNRKTYSLVSLLIGVNNQYRGQSPARYRTGFRKLLQTAVSFADNKPGHVIVLSIPDWGVSGYAAGRDQKQISTDIDAFNAIAQDECQKLGIAYVDIMPLSRRAADDDTQFADDALHYSGKQMQQWAKKALPVVKELLAK